MAFIRGSNAVFVQKARSASYVPCPDGQTITLTSTGSTLYYKSTSDVTSGSSDGNVTTGNSSSALTAGVWVITAQGTQTIVFVKQTEGVTSDLRVGGNLTTAGTITNTGAVTNTGGITPNATHGFSNWQPVAATNGTDTTPADGTLFLTSIWVPANKTVKGVGYLIGSVGGTDRVVVNLWSTAGANLAQSTTTSNGTVCGTAANVQEIDFTATYAAVGPALYYVGVAAKGTTCRLRTVPAFTQAGLFAGSVSQTHGATTAISAPTTFTADKAPVVYLYS